MKTFDTNGKTRLERVMASLRNIRETAGIVYDKNGNAQALVIPAGHPRYSQALEAMGVSSPSDFNAVQIAQAFLTDQYFAIDSEHSKSLAVDVLLLAQQIKPWCKDNSHDTPPAEETLIKAAKLCGLSTRGDRYILGVIHKADVLDGMVL